jgi:two-component system, NarL family, invasion response regulator UvrY
MRILIADDHSVVRTGLRQILLGDNPGACLEEAASCQEVREKIEQNPLWDLVLLDMSMPGGDGFELLKDLRQRIHRVPILVLSMYSEEQFGVRALKCGASGYLNKESAPTELLKAVHASLEGKRYVSPALADKLASSVADPTSATPWDRLSERELFVLRCLYEGLAIKEIAARLEISTKTVSTYRQRILTKLGFSSNAELVQFVLRHNLFSSDQGQR